MPGIPMGNMTALLNGPAMPDLPVVSHYIDGARREAAVDGTRHEIIFTKEKATLTYTSYVSNDVSLRKIMLSYVLS